MQGSRPKTPHAIRTVPLCSSSTEGQGGVVKRVKGNESIKDFILDVQFLMVCRSEDYEELQMVRQHGEHLTRVTDVHATELAGLKRGNKTPEGIEGQVHTLKDTVEASARAIQEDVTKKMGNLEKKLEKAVIKQLKPVQTKLKFKVPVKPLAQIKEDIERLKGAIDTLEEKLGGQGRMLAQPQEGPLAGQNSASPQGEKEAKGSWWRWSSA